MSRNNIDEVSISNLTPDVISSLLQEYMHISAHQFQVEAIDHVIRGKDVILTAGMGLGKSVCFQGIAVVASGKIVLVVSPLKGLMMDQVLSYEIC